MCWIPRHVWIGVSVRPGIADWAYESLMKADAPSRSPLLVAQEPVKVSLNLLTRRRLSQFGEHNISDILILDAGWRQ
jgi:hypothetical protein